MRFRWLSVCVFLHTCVSQFYFRMHTRYACMPVFARKYVYQIHACLCVDVRLILFRVGEPFVRYNGVGAQSHGCKNVLVQVCIIVQMCATLFVFGARMTCVLCLCSLQIGIINPVSASSLGHVSWNQAYSGGENVFPIREQKVCCACVVLAAKPSMHIRKIVKVCRCYMSTNEKKISYSLTHTLLIHTRNQI